MNDRKGDHAECSFLQKGDFALCNIDFADIDNGEDIDLVFSDGNKRAKHSSGILSAEHAQRIDAPAVVAATHVNECYREEQAACWRDESVLSREDRVSATCRRKLMVS